MKIVVAATDGQWKELGKLTERPGLQRVDDPKDLAQHREADAFLNLKDNSMLPDLVALGKPVFINSVVKTLKEQDLPANVLRVNGWATFLQRPAWEIAGVIDENIKAILEALGIKINVVPDEPGFVAARIIAMIVNEAYFAVEDNVSTKKEIDTAMKLGTNYPYGPFEWSSMIGSDNILELLQKLNQTDTRYLPSQLLIKEAGKN